MMGYFENLEWLGVTLGDELPIDITIHSLHKGYNQFVLNFNMNELEKTMKKLLGMLKTAEQSIKVAPKNHVLMIQKKKGVFKKKGNKKQYPQSKGKGKQVVKTKAGATPNQESFHCHKPSHWKRNCPKYLEDKKNGNIASTSGIHVIE